MTPPLVKICGLRSAGHALAAARAGADLLGFNFVEGVRRQLQPDEGRDVIAAYRDAHGPGGPRLVGLFRDQPVEWVSAMIRDAGLDMIQLCGDESPEYAARLKVPAIRPVRVRDETTREQLGREVSEALAAHEMVLLDRYEPGASGGTGRTFDWHVAEGVAGTRGVLLAGGLTPDNVGDAVRLLRPWGVDVASGVETDGTKDPEKIRAFIAASRT